jgi:lactate permease
MEDGVWNQVYDPFNNAMASTIAAALPVVTLLVLIASNRVKAHVAAVVALVVANFVAIVIFTMPANMSLRATVLGAVTGFFPIGWIVLNVIFLYRLTVEKGAFETLQNTLGGVTNDRRLQLLLIAFSFGAFFEGASGFGTPVAVTGAILIGLGFSPLAASGLSRHLGSAHGLLTCGSGCGPDHQGLRQLAHHHLGDASYWHSDPALRD